MAGNNKADKMLNITIQDRALLYKSYMSFLKTGGVFVATDEEFQNGEKVMLILQIMNHESKFPLQGQVVWINSSRSNQQRPRGIGIAFPSDEIGKQAKEVIEKNLAGLLDNAHPTFTM